MKVSINEFGMIMLTPESVWEEFAMKVWREKSIIKIDDDARMLDHHIHPGYIQIAPFEANP